MRISITAALFLILLTNIKCKKEDDAINISRQIEGSWLMLTYININGTITSPYPGALPILKFENNQMKRYSHDTLISEEPYMVSMQIDIDAKKHVPCIITNPMTSYPGPTPAGGYYQSFIIQKDTMYVYSINVLDGSWSTYIRYKN